MWRYTVQARNEKRQKLFFTGAGWSLFYEHATWYPRGDEKLGYALDDAISRGWKIDIVTRRRRRPKIGNGEGPSRSWRRYQN